ncbi:MAG TPA: 23S rRNA (uracil(1939)-C(5))-methyltransferase RlmD [Bacteroidales bacterium]|jgi:23S rRNA (uracil1939-C5)-methyltransferase|nr:23S rRNA (uracil(1939)-C(5))-methyltransferase RlmD [Bacteroidales bacterium]OQB61610.1 MAG: 23S rRNA (uracil-C(5))-methyltransferase RlmCD [Bacteroidetes bacterium ADurb.Bin145]HOU01452.1 23S rRNA (uracil(1939)-C(5))-methyltransferase RlmD [Bacteroidales bacterium]HQG63931.1 23S rRNA (uracil(1939)-C(5))-methyltransferase RlmD [Bacteroidales bacterium]HQK68000.1 23S rRNA (uracil(1939)-C(5))-methyltransferase RlmD [Bacteroidales bacterium]
MIQNVSRKKDLQLLEKITITDIGAEGNALARVDNKVLFIPMLIPGDVVDVRVRKKRKNYLEGSVVRFHEYSKDRVKPLCRHFGECGGCKWQHLPYHLQLQFKEKQVKDSLERIGRLELPSIDPIIGSSRIFGYRNKLEFTFSEKRWLTNEEMNSGNETGNNDALGFHIPGKFDKVMDILECHLQPEPSDSIRNAVRRYAHRKGLQFFNLRQQSGFLRNLIIRNTLDGQLMVIVVFFLDEKERREDLLDFLASEFPQITSLFYIINNKRNDSLADQTPVLYKGEDYLTETMDGLKFRIGPKSFSQTNTAQAVQLYRTARNFAELTGNEIVYDLYTGTGTIANFVASMSRKVIGIEYIEEAVRDAVENSRINNITNTSFFSGDIKDVLSERFVEMNGRPDVIITDPPRAGMHQDVVEKILSLLPSRIVYISCNPATQARDLQLLSGRYYVGRVQPVDMFPHTHHVENVVLMNRSQL